MKKYLFILSLVFAAGATFATFVFPFNGWNELMDRSPDIIIARCTSTKATFNTDKPVSVDGIGDTCDIDVISVLKGNTKPGMSQISSSYQPYQGQRFLLFARYVSSKYFPAYQAAEDYKVVPLDHDFDTTILAGKTLEQQIQLILDSRLQDLNYELAKGNEEKKRLEQQVKMPASATPNRPLAAP